MVAIRDVPILGTPPKIETHRGLGRPIPIGIFGPAVRKQSASDRHRSLRANGKAAGEESVERADEQCPVVAGSAAVVVADLRGEGVRPGGVLVRHAGVFARTGGRVT